MLFMIFGFTYDFGPTSKLFKLNRFMTEIVIFLKDQLKLPLNNLKNLYDN